MFIMVLIFFYEQLKFKHVFIFGRKYRNENSNYSIYVAKTIFKQNYQSYNIDMKRYIKNANSSLTKEYIMYVN